MFTGVCIFQFTCNVSVANASTFPINISNCDKTGLKREVKASYICGKCLMYVHTNYNFFSYRARNNIISATYK